MRPKNLEVISAVISHLLTAVERVVIACLLLALVHADLCGAGETQTVVPIPDAEIVALTEELAEAGKETSPAAMRRTCKSMIRRAQALLEASPAAPNRFAVLDAIFQGQKRLLALEATEQNRDALFETCTRLLTAPDQYAESRLEADLLLCERDLAAVDATVEQRVEALQGIIAKYRGTRAELLSLTLAAMIAAKLQAFDLQEKIRAELADHSFGGNHKAIAFRRRTHFVNSLDAVFSGTYECVDGSSITFPIDRLGHQYLVIFWSQESQGFEGCEAFLARIREQQERFPGRFEVYSFNLDGLPDAGRSILLEAGVKSTALRLPGGRSSSAYMAYALADPLALLVNAQGHVGLRRGRTLPWPRANPARGNMPANPGPGLGKWLDDDRYLAQLRSLFIGDFLVRETALDSIPAETAEAIQSCFIAPPFRYRLTKRESLANYREAARLCAAAMNEHDQTSDLWVIRNCRIIALMGMWNLAREPSYLAEAVKEARSMVSTDLRPDQAFAPLVKGNFKEALRLLDERLPPNMGADPWTFDRLQGRALAHMGLGDWDAALTDINDSIAQRKQASRYGRQINRGVVESHLVRAIILEKLGRAQEAAKERAIVERDLAWLMKTPDPDYPPSYARQGTPVGVYDDLLKKVRLALEEN